MAAPDSETLLVFPCAFPIKAMGRAEAGFAELVAAIVRRHAPDFDPARLRVRPSRGGQWVSVTVVIEARDKAQLDAIYRDLSAHEQVVWAL